MDQHEIQAQIERRRVCASALAEQVAGQSPPEWLIEYFESWAGSLAMHRHQWEQRMSRVEVTEWLKRVEKAALELMDALSEPDFVAFFAGLPEPNEIAVLSASLIKVSELAKSVSESPKFVNEDGKTRAGAALAAPPGSISPQILCALIVMEAWKFIRGLSHGPRNPKAAEAAQTLWSLAVIPGGDRLPRTERHSHGNPLNGWRPHFEALADEAHYESDRAELARYLKDAAHAAKVWSDLDSNS